MTLQYAAPNARVVTDDQMSFESGAPAA
jgi:hypothetical protein